MGLASTPDFGLSADGKDITAIVNAYASSITLTDNSGEKADRLTIALSLPAEIKTPSKGAVLKLSLGITSLINKGKFVVDEVMVTGPPRMVQIVAQSAPMDNSKSASILQSQKTRSWDAITLGNLLKTVANDHGLDYKISQSLENITIDHIDQVSESDMNLMTRISKRYGAVSKPANGYWLLLKEGEGKSVSGNSLSEVTLTPDQVTTWQARTSSRGKPQRVTATYINHDTGLTEEISIGEGTPEFRIAYKYPSKEEAFARISAQVKSAESAGDTLNLTLPVTQKLLSVVAESYLTLEGFGDLEDKRWKSSTVTTKLDRSGMEMTIAAVA